MDGFTRGFVCGQLSVVLVLLVFIRFFIFSESQPPQKKTQSADVVVKRDEDGTVAPVLEKTYYDVEHHPSELLDWFNVLVAQTISQFRTEALFRDNIYHLLSAFLELLPLPDYIDRINLTEVDVGDDFPIFSNCRIRHNSGRLEAKIDVDLADTLTLGIETKILLNHPRPLTAVLPVALTVSMVRFSGCLSVLLLNAEKEGEGSGTALMFSFSPDFRLEFAVKLLIGARAKLQDVPKISQLVESKLRSWFVERCIEPRFQLVKLPSLWPRLKNTRVSDE